jgi:hypothetical protein
VFVTVEQGTRFYATASFYSENRHQVVRHLADHWKTDIRLGLASSTDFASRVVWPPQLAGRDYLELKETQPGTVFEGIRKAVLGPDQEYFPTKAVLAFLDTQGNV